MTREEIQNRALELSREHKHVLLSWSTGVGKSKAAIDILASNENAFWLLVCKETNHIDNWRLEFIKHGHEYLWENNVLAICYSSLHHVRGDAFEGCILDEVHAVSDLRVDRLKQISFDQIISLSATVPYDVKKRLEDLEPFYEYNITTSQAIEWNILPEPVINIVRVELDDKIKKYEWRAHKKSAIQKLTAKEYYDKLTGSIAHWDREYKKDYAEWKKVKMLRAGGDRKKFLADYKHDSASRCIEELRENNKRFICFTGSISQCESLGTNNIHSRIDKKVRQGLIDKFNSLETNELFAVDMLQESMNLNNIDAGIIVQLDNQEKSAVQMIGRALRSIAPEVYILVVKDTQDERYMRTALESMNKKYIKYV